MLPMAYPDAELVVIALTTPVQRTVTSIPAEYDPERDGDLIQVARVGGAPDEDDVTDYPLIQVTCWASTRTGAWALSNRVQPVVLGAAGTAVDRPGDPADGVLIDDAEIAAGNQQLPDLDPDDRKVATTYRLAFRRQYHLASLLPAGIATVRNGTGQPELVLPAS